MAYKFNPPDVWPKPPPGWNPSPDWRPDPSWPAPPEGWNLWIWVEDGQDTHGGVQIPSPPAEALRISPGQSPERRDKKRAKRVSAIIGTLLTVAALVISFFAWVYPDPANKVSSFEERQPYIAQVESLCDKAAEASHAMTERGLNAEQTISRLRAVHLDFTNLLLDWSRLAPPREADVDLIRPMLDSLEAMILSIRRSEELMHDGNATPVFEEFERLREHSREFRQLTRAYGMVRCSDLVLA